MTDREKIDAIAKAMSDEYGPLFARFSDAAEPWVEIVDAVLCEYLGLAEQKPRPTCIHCGGTDKALWNDCPESRSKLHFVPKEQR